MGSAVFLELSLKRRGICCSSFLFPVVWNEDMIARATAAVLDSGVNLKVEAIQGSRHVPALDYSFRLIHERGMLSYLSLLL